MSPSSILYTVKWFQVLLYNSHNLTSVMFLHIVCSCWPIDRILSGATTLGQSEPGSNGNEGGLHIPQISKARALPSECLMSYPEHSLEVGSYLSAEMQSVYATAPVCYILTFDPAQNAIQGDAPEGSDTFQWQLGEEIVWAEIG